MASGPVSDRAVERTTDARGPSATQARADLGERQSPWHLLALWVGFLGPPIAWGAQLLLSDGVAELGCSTGGFGAESASLYAITVVAALLAAGCGVVAARAFVTARDRREGVEATRQRDLFLSFGGIVSAVLFGLLIVVGGFVPHIFLEVCGA